MNASVQISDFSLGGGSNELKAQTNWKVNFLSQFVPRMLFYQVEIPGNKCSNLKIFRSSTVHWIYDLCLFSAKQLNWYLWLSLILDGNKHYVSKFQAIVPKPYACESSVNHHMLLHCFTPSLPLPFQRTFCQAPAHGSASCSAVESWQ